MSGPVKTFEEKKFQEAVESIVNEMELPTGSIGRDHIRTRAIQPQHCNLSGSWDFTGPVSFSYETTINPFTVQVERVFDNHVLGSSPICIADASKKNLCIMLPDAKQNENYVYILKRSDSNEQSTCELMASGNDRIDDVTSISIPIRGSLMCVSSGFRWHILANYS